MTEENQKKKALIIKLNGKKIHVDEKAIPSTPGGSPEEQIKGLKRVAKEKIFAPASKEKVRSSEQNG